MITLKSMGTLMMYVIKMLFKSISYLISPPSCIDCGVFLQERFPVCSLCADEIKPVVSHKLQVTSKQHITVYAVGNYEGIIKTLIMGKHAGKRLAAYQLGQLIADYCQVNWNNYDIVVPVPLHWRRYAQRGFNQSAEIANFLSQKYALTISRDVYRTAATRYQAELDAHARRANVRHVFALSAKAQQLYQDKHIIIVDDLLTTGATLASVARQVLACKPASVIAVVAARVVLK